SSSGKKAPVDTENPVRIENAGFRFVREIIIVSKMSPFFIALLALVSSTFRARAALQAEIVASDIRSPSFNRARHVVYAFDNLTDFCGFGCPAFLAGLAALAAHPEQWPAGIGGRLRAIGPANRAAAQEDQVSLPRSAI